MQTLLPQHAKNIILHGGVIAYPTEAVYGIGCDPDNAVAVEKILKLKQRPWQKGLILIGSHLAQFAPYVDFSKISPAQLAFAQSKWPGPFTFVMPSVSTVSPLLRGNFDTIAIRVSSHPVVQSLCNELNKPLVSTSANIAGEEPATNQQTLVQVFNHQLDAIISGEIGMQTQPSTIIDVITGKILRQG